MANDVVSLFRDLVACRSVSAAPSRELAEWVVTRAGAADDETTVQPYDSGRKANVLLLRGPRDTERAGLLLNGHLDVVPADEPGWESDPWELTDGGDRWTARGACDMKGFVALAIDRFRRLDATQLQAPLGVLLTSDEEVGSRGAQHWVREHGDRPIPRQVLVGEPTELQPVRLHKGHLRLGLEISGRSAHSGYPDRGRSAIVPAGRAITALDVLAASLRAETSHAEQFPEVPFAALNVGRIDGGSAVNVIPERCRLEIGVRLMPGMDGASVAERVRRTLEPALGGSDWELAIDNESPALETRADAPLLEALRATSGESRDLGASFSSDAGALSRAGFDCVLFGAGSIEVAHQPNEYLPKHEFEKLGAVVDDLIERFCGARPR